MLVVLSALAFFLLITGLILVHELGHYIAARMAGITVEEFGFGLPPRAKKLFKYEGTIFSLNWIPFGGFVRLKGENAVEEDGRLARGSFARASILARCIVLVAGVFMNFVVAFLVFLYGFSYGQWIPTYLSLAEMRAAADQGEIHLRLGVLIGDVLTGGGAADAGIEPGSVVTHVDGKVVEEPIDVVNIQMGKSTSTYTLKVEGSEEPVLVEVAVQDGKTGVLLSAIPIELSAPRRGPVDAIMLSLREAKVVTVQTVIGIAKLFSSLAQTGTVPEGVTGIVGIAQLTYTSVQQGLMVYMRLVALLSLSLAVLNILPFPALDGGRLLFVLSELIIRPGNRRFEVITNTVGFGILLLIIILVTLYDVIRLIAS